MRKISYGLIGLSLLLCSVTTATAEISIGIGLPNVSIGINLPLYPDLVRVPGYPVYYAPRLDANYFFYDGMYWVYQDDYWYASSWYNGPWGIVAPEFVPLYVLRIPVRYYRQPPEYFREWRTNAPPRWGQHWGRDWEQHRRGWDQWKRNSAPAPAPLPVYQRKYSGDRYPRAVEQQHELRNKSYRYQPRDKVVREHFRQPAVQKAPAPAQRTRQNEPPMNGPKRQETSRPVPRQQQPHQVDENVRRPDRGQTAPQQQGPAIHEQKQHPGNVQHEERKPRVIEQRQKPQDRDVSQEPRQDRGRGHDKDEERGRGRKD